MYFAMVRRGGVRKSKDVPSWVVGLFLVFSVVGMFFVAFANYDIPQFSGDEGEEGIHVSHEFITDDQVRISASVYFEDVVFLTNIQIFADNSLVEECDVFQEGGDGPPGDNPENSPRFSGYHSSCEYTSTFSEGVHSYYGSYSTQVLGTCSDGACTENTAVVATCPAGGDSDNGDPMVEGSMSLDSVGITIVDTCFDSNYLKEYTCAGENEFRVEFYECGNGCVDGQCIEPVGEGVPYYEDICQFSSASGNNPMLPGGVRLYDYVDSIDDVCENEGVLWEYYCVGDSALGGIYLCDVPAVGGDESDVVSFTVSFDDGSDDNGNGNGGGGTPGGSNCVEDWSCTGWTDCVADQRTRECNDLNLCGTENHKPIEVENCESPWGFFPFDLKSINWWYASAFLVGALILVWLVAFILRKRGWE